jgi:hypothetical protein
MPEHRERLELRQERDPMLLDGETGREDGEVQVDPGEAGEAERDAQKLKRFHHRSLLQTRASCDQCVFTVRGSIFSSRRSGRYALQFLTMKCHHSPRSP